ncbi:hypothetical protein VNO77_06685 [Canavalia gladiata]|uniref:caffeate O-methyltransferase n=1 Tax=Canavalia gladiata TaxID=3824 RepID=A0AAN9QVR4_CANGL
MAPTTTLESSNGEAKHHKEEGLSVPEEQDGLLFGLNLMTSVVFPLAVKTAVELGIFDIIAKSGEGAKVSAEEVLVHLNAKNPDALTMVDRLLRLLSSHSLLSCSISDDQQAPKRLYSLNYASKYFVTDADGVSFGESLYLPLDKVFLGSWTELKGAILEGGVPFNRVYGMHAFEYPAVDPRFNDVFNKAMFNITTIVTKRMLEVYQGFEKINRLVDVGGGLGINLKLIVAKYPHIHGINFDLPHVLEHAPAYPGVEHVGGDMFESVPKGDAIFMKWILHDWSDEHCLKLLKNCHKAIPDDGKVIIVDFMLPNLPEGTIAAKTGFQGDLLMMTQNPGGKERTQNQFLELALGAGFSGIKLASYVSGFSVIEFYK